MDAKTKYQKQFESKQKNNGDKKVSKVNWGKISIIFIIVFLLLLGLGLGLYFGLRTTLPDVGVSKISVNEALGKADDLEDGEHMGIVFASKDSSVANYALYGEEAPLDSSENIEDQKEAEGALGQFLINYDYVQTPGFSNWYMVESDTTQETKDNIEKFLIADGYDFGRTDDYESNDPGPSPFTGATYIGQVQNNQTLEMYQEENNDSYQENVNFDIVNDSTDPSHLKIVTDLVVDDGSTETTTYSSRKSDDTIHSELPFDSPTIFWLEGVNDLDGEGTHGELSFFSIGNVVPSTSTSDTSTGDPLTTPAYNILNSQTAYELLGKKLS